jgi:hypothetical protein
MNHIEGNFVYCGSEDLNDDMIDFVKASGRFEPVLDITHHLVNT